MTPRTKWLLLAGLSIFGLYMADSFYRSWIEQPSQRLNAEFESLSDKLNQAKNDQLVAQKIGKRLDEYAARSLPSDPQLARSSYQKWLLQLVEKHHLSSASVDAAQPIGIEIKSRTKKGKRRIGYRINYSLRSQATLATLKDFLVDFRQAGHLHKIRSLALNPIGNEGRLDANLSIEVLCMETSTNREELGDWVLIEEKDDVAPAHESFVRRNLFSRGFAKALFEIQLKAITFNRDGIAEAWFKIDGRGTTKAMIAGAQVPVPLHDISIEEVLADRVLVRVNQDSHWIKLGQSIGEICTPKIDTALGDKR